MLYGPAATAQSGRASMTGVIDWGPINHNEVAARELTQALVMGG